MNRKIIIDVKTRDRIEKQIKNSILAHASVEHQGGLCVPGTSEGRAEAIAERVTKDIMRDYRLVPRK